MLKAVRSRFCIERRILSSLHPIERSKHGGFNRSSQHPNLGGVDDNGKTKIRTVHAG